MGRLIYSMSVSLDGFVNDRDGSLDWVIVDEELHRAFNDEARGMGAFVYGRRMDELMTAYWPTAEDDPAATPAELDFARIWRDTPRIVLSRTPEAVEEIARLRRRPGFDMSVGGPTAAATLLRAGLVDEVRCYVNPVILGGGTPFLPRLDPPIALRLLETRTFASGVVYLGYATTDAS
jgi:dihydrofolate reductase